MPISVSEFRLSIQDDNLRSDITEIISITSLLSNCIVDKNFRLSDEWIRPLKFSDLGEEVIQKAMEVNRRLKPNDAKMAVFLRFGCASGLLVDFSTDIDGLRSQMSSEILNQHIRYP